MEPPATETNVPNGANFPIITSESNFTFQPVYPHSMSAWSSEFVELKPVVWPRPQRPLSIYLIVATSLYSVLFLIGIVGNLRAIAVLAKAVIQRCRTAQHNGSKYIHIYLISLSIVDTLALAFLPVIIADVIKVPWFYGSMACRALWTVENLNKILSSFILLALSAFCFFTIKNPHLKPDRTETYVQPMALVIGSTLFASILMSPVYLFSNVFNVLVKINNTYYVVATKCLFRPPETVLVAFTGYTFTLAYLIPTCLQLYCYGSILFCVQQHMRHFERSGLPFWRISRRAMLLVSFYLICWSPYWSSLIYHYLHSTQPKPRSNTPIYLSLFLHALPYINAAVNPTLYLYMNRTNLQSAVVAAGHAYDSVSNLAAESRSNTKGRRRYSMEAEHSSRINSTRTYLSPLASEGRPSISQSIYDFFFRRRSSASTRLTNPSHKDEPSSNANYGDGQHSPNLLAVVYDIREDSPSQVSCSIIKEESQSF